MNDQRFTRRLPEVMDDLAGSDDRYVDDVLLLTARIRQRPSWSFPPSWMPGVDRGPRTWAGSKQLAIGLTLLALLGLVAASTLGIGGPSEGLLVAPAPSTAPEAYEAVVLRPDMVQDGTPDLLVVAVDADGREREITRLEMRAGPWEGSGYPWEGSGYFHLPAAISPTGLLAIPRGPGIQMHWEIIDLRRPEAAPLVVPGIEQDVEQLGWPYFSRHQRPGIFWGPDDQLAIPWYKRVPLDSTGSSLDYHVSFVDGRTGDATAIDVPVDATNQQVPGQELAILPEWARDGSGIIVSLGNSYGQPGQRSLLRRDGSMADDSMELADATCRTQFRSGRSVLDVTAPAAPESRFSCIAPDDSMVVQEMEGTSVLMINPDGNTRQAVEGNFAGWLEVMP